MLRMEKLCYTIGFTQDMVNRLLAKKEAIRCNGKIYSEEHKRRFEIKNDIFKIEKSSVDENKLVLTINRQPIGEWFKEQWEKYSKLYVNPCKQRGEAGDSECNQIAFNWISIKLRIFANGLRELFP